MAPLLRLMYASDKATGHHAGLNSGTYRATMPDDRSGSHQRSGGLTERAWSDHVNTAAAKLHILTAGCK